MSLVSERNMRNATATQCNTLQHAATHCITLHQIVAKKANLSLVSDRDMRNATIQDLRRKLDKVCRSFLQCVAVCCSALQCVEVCCSALQCLAVSCSVLQCLAVCCSVLQCVAVCCRFYTTSARKLEKL